MNEDVLNEIKNIMGDNNVIDDYYDIIKEAIDVEMGLINNGMFVEICELESGFNDGIYINKGQDNYYVNKVESSIKHPFKADYTDVVKMLAYSYIIRILSYVPSTPFVLIKEYTREIERIIKKY